MSKFYAVKKGRKPGIYNDWNECSKQVIGYSQAVYKSFFTIEEAKKFLEDKNESVEILVSGDKAIAYVDGSYSIKTGEFSYGAVVFYKGEEYCFNQKFNNFELASMRNVAGEIEGAKKAMSFCIENKISEVDIYYDYRGIECWANGEWDANKKGTIEYKNYYNRIKKKLKVNFIKVKAHSNNKYNDMADKLAKDALK